MSEKKIQDNKEVTKMLYFTYLEGSPSVIDVTQKLRGG